MDSAQTLAAPRPMYTNRRPFRSHLRSWGWEDARTSSCRDRHRPPPCPPPPQARRLFLSLAEGCTKGPASEIFLSTDKRWVGPHREITACPLTRTPMPVRPAMHTPSPPTCTVLGNTALDACRCQHRCEQLVAASPKHNLPWKYPAQLFLRGVGGAIHNPQGHEGDGDKYCPFTQTALRPPPFPIGRTDARVIWQTLTPTPTFRGEGEGG